MARRKRYKTFLSARSFQSTLEKVDNYRQTIQLKCEAFVRALAEKGIVVAKQNVGGYGTYITFGVTVDPLEYGARAIMYATNNSLIHVEWIGAGVAYGEADISPLLMAEFGSGLRAQQNPRGPEFGYGTGTFPGQIHAEDPEGWWYQTLDGEWHHSFGVTPTMPMGHAHEEILQQVAITAREVFR